MNHLATEHFISYNDNSVSNCIHFGLNGDIAEECTLFEAFDGQYLIMLIHDGHCAAHEMESLLCLQLNEGSNPIEIDLTLKSENPTVPPLKWSVTSEPVLKARELFTRGGSLWVPTELLSKYKSKFGCIRFKTVVKKLDA